jgi:hypothetical protein
MESGGEYLAEMSRVGMDVLIIEQNGGVRGLDVVGVGCVEFGGEGQLGV